MAVRRMFHTEVVQSDAFLDLPLAAQALYLQICMAADDDGFLNSARRMARLIGAGQEDLDSLVDSGFLMKFGDVYVVRHWRQANSLKNDRLRLPSFPEVAEKIYLLETRAYTEIPQEGQPNLLEAKRISLGESAGPGRNPFGIPEEKRREEPRREEPSREEESQEEQNGEEESQEEKNLTEPIQEKKREEKEMNLSDSGCSREGVKKEKESGGFSENPWVSEESAADASDGGAERPLEEKDRFRLVEGKLGKGVLMLTQSQMEDLLEKMGIDCFDYYTDKLSSFILNNNARVKNHYATILRWWQEDAKTGG